MLASSSSVLGSPDSSRTWQRAAAASSGMVIVTLRDISVIDAESVINYSVMRLVRYEVLDGVD